MSIKMFVFFVFIFTTFTFISMVGEQGGGFAATNLTAPIDSSATTINVVSTENFLDQDYLWIVETNGANKEKILYTGRTSTTFTGLSRGVDTTAAAHATNARVFTEQISALNDLVGFNVAVSNSTVGSLKTVIHTATALTFALPKLIAWDYSFLDNRAGTHLKYFLYYPISAGLVISFVVAFASIMWGILRPA